MYGREVFFLSLRCVIHMDVSFVGKEKLVVLGLAALGITTLLIIQHITTPTRRSDNHGRLPLGHGGDKLKAASHGHKPRRPANGTVKHPEARRPCASSQSPSPRSPSPLIDVASGIPLTVELLEEHRSKEAVLPPISLRLRAVPNPPNGKENNPLLSPRLPSSVAFSTTSRVSHTETFGNPSPAGDTHCENSHPTVHRKRAEEALSLGGPPVHIPGQPESEKGRVNGQAPPSALTSVEKQASPHQCNEKMLQELNLRHSHEALGSPIRLSGGGASSCDDLSPIPHADCALAYSLNSPLDTNRGNPSLVVPRYLLLDVERQLRALLADIELSPGNLRSWMALYQYLKQIPDPVLESIVSRHNYREPVAQSDIHRKEKELPEPQERTFAALVREVQALLQTQTTTPSTHFEWRGASIIIATGSTPPTGNRRSASVAPGRFSHMMVKDTDPDEETGMTTADVVASLVKRYSFMVMQGASTQTTPIRENTRKSSVEEEFTCPPRGGATPLSSDALQSILGRVVDLATSPGFVQLHVGDHAMLIDDIARVAADAQRLMVCYGMEQVHAGTASLVSSVGPQQDSLQTSSLYYNHVSATAPSIRKAFPKRPSPSKATVSTRLVSNPSVSSSQQIFSRSTSRQSGSVVGAALPRAKKKVVRAPFQTYI